MVQGSSPPDEDTMLNVDSPSLQADEESRGDYNRKTLRNEQPIMTAEEISSECACAMTSNSDIMFHCIHTC